MGLYNLDKIFKPESVAVIGASEKKESLGRAIMENLMEGGFEGDIIPVNPKHDRVLDRTCYPSLSEADTTPDLAVIATPIQSVPDIIDESARIGVGGAIIISAGGKEMGEKGEKLEEDIQHRAAEGGVRLIGPNCLGIIRPGKNLNASFANQMPLKGKLAFVSQSGAICTAILDLSLQENFGFSHFVSIGSMADVDFGDLIDYQGHASDVTSILLYVESLTHIRKFMSAARAVS
ncbi:MAG: CoA-binding protein, partial [Thermodesulfobacteriota bacterium]